MTRLTIVLLAFSLPAFAQEQAATPEGSESEAASEADSQQTDRERASVRFRRGVDFYAAGDFRAALIEFRRANEIAPNYRVLYNIGQASFQLHDYAEAKAFFEQYLREGGDEIDEARRAEVEAELATLAQYVSELSIEVNVEGAEVSVDEQVVGTSPLYEPVSLSAGRRRVQAQLEGYAPVERVVDLAGGETQTLELDLVPLAADANPTTTTRLSPVFWVSLATTAAAALGAVTTGVLSLGADSDLDSELAQFPVDATAVANQRDKVDRLTLTTDILLAVAGVGAVVTLFVGIFGQQTVTLEDTARVEPTANGFRVRF